MKSSKTFLYLAILVVLLVAAYFLTADRGEKTSSYKLDKTKIFEIDSAKVDKISITNKDGKMVLEKVNGEWRIVEPGDYKVNSSLVETAISDLKKFKLESVVSTNPEKKASFGFDDLSQAEVEVFESGNSKGKFLIGNGAAGAGQTFVKKMEGDEIYLADDLTKFNIIKSGTDEWRDKNIVAIPKVNVNSVEFISDAETFTVKRDSSGKYFIGQDSVGTAFDGILNLLGKFDTQYFKDTTLAADTKFNNIIRVDWGPKTELKFLKQDSTPVKYLLAVTDNPQIFVLEEGFAKNLLKTKKEILGR